MKIMMQCNDIKVTWEKPNDDVTIDEVIQGITTCLLGLTWYEKTIMDGYKEAVDEYNERIEDEKVRTS